MVVYCRIYFIHKLYGFKFEKEINGVGKEVDKILLCLKAN